MTADLLATTGADGAARIWDVGTGEMLHEVTAGRGSAVSPSFDGNGDRFAASWPTADGSTIRIVDVAERRTVAELDVAPGVLAASLDPEGVRVAAASSQEPTASIIDAGSGETIAELSGPRLGMLALAWSPDGSSVATVDGATVRIFDAATGIQQMAVVDHGAEVTSMDWSPDGARLVTGSADGTAKVSLLIEGAPRHIALLTAQDTRTGVRSVAFSPDGTQVVTGNASADTVLFWDVGVSAGREIANLPAVAFVPSVAEFAADGRSLFTTGTVWHRLGLGRRDIGAGGHPARPRASPPRPGAGGPSGRAGRIGWRRVPHRLDTGCIDDRHHPARRSTSKERAAGIVQVWDIDTGTVTFDVAMGGWASDIIWSGDGQYLAISGGDGESGSVRVVNRSGRTISEINVPNGYVESSAFSSDTTRLFMAIEALGTYDPRASRVQIVDWRTTTTIRTVPGEAWDIAAGPVDVFATSSNPRAAGQTVTIWNAEDGQQQVSVGRAHRDDPGTCVQHGRRHGRHREATTGSCDCGIPRPGRNC